MKPLNSSPANFSPKKPLCLRLSEEELRLIAQLRERKPSRQVPVDRQEAKHDYEVNLKAELEIERLHDQLQSLQEEELAEMTQLLKQQQVSLDRISAWVAQQRTR